MVLITEHRSEQEAEVVVGGLSGGLSKEDSHKDEPLSPSPPSYRGFASSSAKSG